MIRINRNNISLIYLLAVPAVIMAFLSCRKDEMITDPSAKLSFSTDTIMFDTIFTSIGSTTKNFKVYNRHKQEIKISSIVLAKRDNSNFRLNINGTQADIIRDVIIPPEDSIFIFVEVTIDPGRDEMVEQDSVVFLTNGNTQDIDLVAYGQDVVLMNGSVIASDTVWTCEKPFLVYNYLYVDSLIKLTIEPGTHIHFHHQAALYVGGTLIVNGTCDAPVVFQGDRLEDMYDDLPGQWGYIHLLAGSKDNVIDHAEIRNAIIGIRVDTMMNTNPTLVLTNTVIENMNAVGLYALGAYVKAMNCVFADCGQFTVALTIGGAYEFHHCTMADYWNYSTRNTPAVLLNNYYQDIYGTYQVRELAMATFTNCIIHGSLENEMALDSFPDVSGYFNYFFDHCLLKVNSEINTGDQYHFSGTALNKDPKFVDIEEADYRLEDQSDAIDAGNPEILGISDVLLQDIKCDLRDAIPDIGAFEKVE